MKLKEIQSTISKELEALEEDVRRQAAPQTELDELFDFLFKKLEEKYVHSRIVLNLIVNT